MSHPCIFSCSRILHLGCGNSSLRSTSTGLATVMFRAWTLWRPYEKRCELTIGWQVTLSHDANQTPISAEEYPLQFLDMDSLDMSGLPAQSSSSALTNPHQMQSPVVTTTNARNFGLYVNKLQGTTWRGVVRGLILKVPTIRMDRRTGPRLDQGRERRTCRTCFQYMYVLIPTFGMHALQ